MSHLKVAVIGAGSVGKTLGGKLIKAGFHVKYGSRNPTSDKAKELTALQPAAGVAGIKEAVTWADAIILATTSIASDAGIQATAESLGDGVAGKVIIDATNPLSAWPGLEIRWNEGISGGEVLQAALPTAAVYKAFNSVGVEKLGDPEVNGVKLVMLFAGPPEHKDIAAAVIAGVGFEPAYVGPIRYARNLEAIAELWIHLSIPVGEIKEAWGRNFHFQVLRGN